MESGNYEALEKLGPSCELSSYSEKDKANVLEEKLSPRFPRLFKETDWDILKEKTHWNKHLEKKLLEHNMLDSNTLDSIRSCGNRIKSFYQEVYNKGVETVPNTDFMNLLCNFMNSVFGTVSTPFL